MGTHEAEGPEQVFIKGESGMIITMDLPLHETILDKLAKGTVRRVNEDGSVYVPDEDEDDDGVPGLPTEKPPVNAPKADWVAWAVANEMAVEAAEKATKQDLIDLFGG